MATQLIEKKLEFIVKKGVEDALKAQFPKMRALLTLNISIEEQKEIERLYRRPSKKATRSFKLAV
ncbi:hypothetical protein A2662_02595 [Candidatus Giovannonibacteria bacterium RIFCSPHIGHO2_01_FULL_45_33]|uniref:Uncharacterized protein n=1 Tax=Candidatus Giovannonibacteria bacterium RIFCSPLOWO2_01_FULL_45_34 TaxID=1798351 RepID=A0A1F5WYH7_9BACT|nr:MAG: hypothetical protein A2662_02595 [Candidatus Giovannonibacteria bacterium RIFCSPHIGHO2_01_FULL_45_33]OGF70969.1 MAG: hypothetical protein A3C73_04055 [Candidatus Giovannonibacteria bacterium RIFCSPHIGHO2_02_FULL_44_11]OGF80688.1 MAG: hypothetical protein A2930_01820 [Candidatus Giovannonibacteria bacterium RIFCSPLOWO2_01_FULL_45_34]